MGKVKKHDRVTYTEEDLQKALKALKTGRPLAAVSREFNIPKSTLFDKKKGRSKPVIGKRGPESVLGAENEMRLVEWIMYMYQQGFPVTKDQLMNSVQRLLKNIEKEHLFANGRPGRHWFEGFQNRHPELCQRLSQNMHRVRVAVTEEKIRLWFGNVEDYLISKNLRDIEASRVFNCDESGFYLCPRGQRVLAKKGDRYAYNFVNNDDKECVTALFCGNACGQILPPMVMFNYVRIPSAVASLMPKGWGIGRSDSGWMTAASFYEWMANIFYPWLIENSIKFPVVSFLDGHSSHLTLELSDFCREKSIELVALHPHSTHILQPMDVAVFHPLKLAWKAAVPDWRIENGGQRLKREHFAQVLMKAMNKLDWKKILCSGFRATGLHPFSPDAINYEKHLKKSSQCTSQVPSPPEDHQCLTYLEFIEMNIDNEVLESFKLIPETDEWKGDIRHASLFSFWRKTKNLARSKEQGQFSESRESEVTQRESESQKNQDETDPEKKERKLQEELVVEESISAENDEVHVPLEDLSGIQDILVTLENNAEGLVYHVSEEGILIPIEDLENTKSFGIANSDNIPEHDLNNNSHNDLSLKLDPSNHVSNVHKQYQILQCSQDNSNEPSTELRSELNAEIIEKAGTEAIQGDEKKITKSESPIAKNDPPLPSIPSPFKKSLYWPSGPKHPTKKTRSKEQLPSAITSDAWNNYYKNKREKERKEKEEKERRKEERLRNRELKMKEKEAARLARTIKKEKSMEQKKLKEKAMKKSPTLVVKKRAIKRKEIERKIKNEQPEVAKEIKKELFNDSVESNEDLNSPPAKVQIKK